MRYLREPVLAHPAQKLILEEYLQRIDAAEKQVGRIEKQMLMLLETWKRRPLVEAAMVVIAEIGDFRRFKHPKQLMAYLRPSPKGQNTGACSSVVPCEHVVRRLNQHLFCGKAALECGDAVSAFRAPTGSDALQGATRNPLQHFILAAEGLLFRAQPRNKPRYFHSNFLPIFAPKYEV
jgi:hypothetical protein